MKKEELKELSNEALQKKEKSTKTLIGIFIPIILVLLFFGVRDYLNGEANTPVTIITICSIGGMVILFPELKSIREELKDRNL
ncbi:MAG: hypothetical protein AAGG68_02480 [Bacteroidota bacterium]